MKQEVSVIIERDIRGYYVASVPQLRGCHSQAKTLDSLMDRIKEAIELCLEVQEETDQMEFVGLQRIRVGNE
jgi:predicted RNase H-like HicB family nuclease